MPADRLAPGALLELASSRLSGLEGEELEEALKPWVERVVPAAAGLDEAVIRVLENRRIPEDRRVAAPEESGPAPVDPPAPAAGSAAEMVAIPAGRYLVGRPREEATFFNQQPRFEVEVRAFLIDAAAVGRDSYPSVSQGRALGSPAEDGLVGGVSWNDADAFCRTRGAALPSELEWEVAMSTGLVQQGRLEWTSSWYLPYPGNTVEEPEYGRQAKVIRGAGEPADFDRHRRLFAPPDTRDPRLGFRCAAPVR